MRNGAAVLPEYVCLRAWDERRLSCHWKGGGCTRCGEPLSCVLKADTPGSGARTAQPRLQHAQDLSTPLQTMYTLLGQFLIYLTPNQLMAMMLASLFNQLWNLSKCGGWGACGEGTRAELIPRWDWLLTG